MTPLLAIPLAAILNVLRGEDKPTKSEQINRVMFGLAIASPFAFAGLWLEYVVASVGGFIGMLIPHGSWLGYKYWTDRLWIAGVCALRGALVAAPLWGWPVLWVALFSAIIGALMLELGHKVEPHARADIIWHAGWAAFIAVALIVAI